MLKTYAKELAHIGLPTGDYDKTMDFYKGLGFDVVLETTDPGNGNRVAFIELAGTQIETYEYQDPAGKPGAIDHIAIDVTDVDAVFELLKSKGYELLDEEVQFLPFWENGTRFFTIMGPNGEKLEFCAKC